MENDLLYQIALTLVPNIGDVHAKALVNIFGDAQAIFKAKMRDLENIEGIGKVRAGCLKAFTDFTSTEAEIKFIEQYKITPLFINNPSYPKRLLNCYDSPTMLYYRGTADLNQSKIIAMVGSRTHTDYGKIVCEKFVEDCKNENILVISGLAYGIDSIAHKAALKHNLPTVGVLAHGLDRVYPAQNKILARQMVNNGGLLTEFMSQTNPDKQNFPKRNRIVAGMCDAVLVIETGKKGGSLITAELGNGYNKDVFAIPGRVTDSKSEGCNYLIKNNKASLVNNAEDLIELMNWKPAAKKERAKQRQLFIELTADERIIVDILQQQPQASIDELYSKAGLSSSAVAAALLMLEMENVIASLPGKIYKII